MSRFNCISRRVGLPIAIGLVLIALALTALAAPAAQAIPVAAPIERSPINSALAPNVPLTIPLGTAPTKLDGQCPRGRLGLEWDDALALPYSDLGVTGTVLLKHDSAYLYVCLQAASGQASNRFASVYLDTLDTRQSVAGPTDYGLRANIVSGTLSSVKGAGAGGYVSMTLSGWTASTFTGAAAASDGAEYRIPLALTGGACGKPFGLAVYHHWVNGSGASDYGWPSNQWYDQPQTWQEVALSQTTCGSGPILYVYQRDTATAGQFKTLLTSAGFTVTTAAIGTVPSLTVSNYDLVIVADDTGDLDQWGASPSASGVISQIVNSYKPVIGLGEGGYAFLGKANSPIGWPHGWHGLQDRVIDAGFAPNYYHDPNDLSGLLPGPFSIYTSTVNEVGIYMTTAPASVMPIGWEPHLGPQGAPDHAALALDGCYHLWGFSGNPAAMNGAGQRLFVNAVSNMRFSECPRPTPPDNCLTVTKTATPPDGSAVYPNDAITYTLAYTVANNDLCVTSRSRLIDPLPDHTLFVPGSAGRSIVPNFDNTLQWNLGPLNVGAHGSQSFKVSVLDTACRSGAITNTAKLQTDLGTFTSNTITHKVTCPPVIPPNNDPPYAESEIQIYPYPLVTGHPTNLSVRVFNNSATLQTVTVTFQTSPNRFGIGIPFGTLPVPGNPRVITIGAYGYAEVLLNWTPVSSGHYCMQVKIESAGYAPIYTYRNLDVTEDLKPGVTDVLTFSVANPTAVTATITLVVVNTCPGWTASVNPSQIVNAVPGTIYTATLSVTPPNPATLGTGCHIDVQGWIGNQLIGGIRKLDVPPVNLPHADPSWLEKEISTIPTPPISGAVNQVCIELQNPLGFARQVTVIFSEAVFGAVPFTPINPVSTHVFNLPPYSLQNYCVDWLPFASAEMHHCLRVTLQQPGFHDQTSQRNVNLVRRPLVFDPSTIHVPFSIGNPFPFPGKVKLNGILIGLNQWTPKFTPDPPPDGLDIGVGEILSFTLELAPAVQQLAPQATTEVTFSGDVVRADVEVLLNDEPANGFSVEFAPPLQVFLPLVLK